MLSLGGKKKITASRESTHPFPQPSSLKISQLPFHRDQQGMLHLTIPKTESEGSSALPEQPQPPARAAVATVTQEKVKKHKQDKNPETLEKLGKLEFWGDFVVLFLFFFLSPEESFEKGSPHYCPVHHITFQFLSSASPSKPDCS